MQRVTLGGWELDAGGTQPVIRKGCFQPHYLTPPGEKRAAD